MIDVVVAYIDPGSGSLVIQMLIATIVAIPVIFRTQISRFVRSVRPKKEAPPAADDQHVDAG